MKRPKAWPRHLRARERMAAQHELLDSLVAMVLDRNPRVTRPAMREWVAGERRRLIEWLAQVKGTEE